MNVYYFRYDPFNGDLSTFVVIADNETSAFLHASECIPVGEKDELELVHSHEVASGVLVDLYYDHETNGTEVEFPKTKT